MSALSKRLRLRNRQLDQALRTADKNHLAALIIDSLKPTTHITTLSYEMQICQHCGHFPAPLSTRCFHPNQSNSLFHITRKLKPC